MFPQHFVFSPPVMLPGQMDQAKGAVAEVLRLVPESSIKRDVYGQVAYARESDRERYAAALRKAGLPEE